MTDLKEMILNGDLYTIEDAVISVLESSSPDEIIKQLIDGMNAVGEKYQEGELFLPDLIKSAETFKEGMKRIEEALDITAQKSKGKIVLGTVRGDLHDLGKNLVALMLESAGIEVIDLGIDVSPDDFVKAVKEHKPQLIGMSSLLTSTMIEIENTIQALEKAGLREKVKIMIGGAPVSKRFAEKIGADAYAIDAVEAVKKATELLN